MLSVTKVSNFHYMSRRVYTDRQRNICNPCSPGRYCQRRKILQLMRSWSEWWWIILSDWHISNGGLWLALKVSLSFNALRTCVYIYIWQLSSLRAPTLWFIDLSVLAIFNSLFWVHLMFFILWENGQNTKILEVCMATDGYYLYVHKALILRTLL